MFVITADQRDSRSDRDRVDDLLESFQAVPAVRGFDRTAGDEVEGVFDDAAEVARIAVELACSGFWSVGIGIGPVEHPLPAEARAGRGRAFEAARTAVEAAKTGRFPLSIVGESRWCSHAQTAAWHLLDLIGGRSEAGREAVALVSTGLSQSEAAGRIGISPQAVSLRLQAARWELQPPTEELLVALLTEAADGP